MERRRIRRGCDEYVRRIDAERLIKISRDNLPAGRRSPGRQKRRWSDLIPTTRHSVHYLSKQIFDVDVRPIVDAYTGSRVMNLLDQESSYLCPGPD